MVLLLVIASFILGSVPTGWVLAKVKGVDLRQVGSGNIGATNVLRGVGKGAALITLIGDMAKGAVPIYVARAFFPELGLQVSAEGAALLGITITDPRIALECALGLAAILGHNFSIFLKFKGGKGIATSLGAVFALSPHVALLSATIWLFTLSWSGYSSLSALVAFGALPLSFSILDPSQEKTGFAVIVAVLAFIRHMPNIRRLLSGTESKVFKKKR